MRGPSVAYSSTSSTAVEFAPSPINWDWVLEGAPKARSVILSRSQDQTACTIMWDCTAGKFRWIYDFDETIHFLEGSVLIDDGGSAPRLLGPGDVVFFPAGSSAIWSIENYVRKLAFCRKALPAPVGAAFKTLRLFRNAIRGASAGASLMQRA
ncbi:MAG TPA: cupin domain-containing protein [Roseiarcus sp.]|nr:cupin domain-containing protein [Roseiarcus sp.]